MRAARAAPAGFVVITRSNVPLVDRNVRLISKPNNSLRLRHLVASSKVDLMLL